MKILKSVWREFVEFDFMGFIFGMDLIVAAFIVFAIIGMIVTALIQSVPL